MKQIQDDSLKEAKRRFIVSIVFLIIGIIYTISPVDFIPDALFPIGFFDDIFILIIAVILSAHSYFKLKKMREINSGSNTP